MERTIWSRWCTVSRAVIPGISARPSSNPSRIYDSAMSAGVAIGAAVEARIDALMEDQCQIRTGQHDRFAPVHAGQGVSRPHENLSLSREQRPDRCRQSIRRAGLTAKGWFVEGRRFDSHPNAERHRLPCECRGAACINCVGVGSSREHPMP